MNPILSCHHVKLQKGCTWCDIYLHQSVRACDRCDAMVNSDLVYLSLVNPQPQLICTACRLDEIKWGSL